MADNVIFKLGGKINGENAPSYQKGQILFSIEEPDLGYIYIDNGNTADYRVKISAYKAENDLNGKAITSYMTSLTGTVNDNDYTIKSYDAYSELINEIQIPGATVEKAGLVTISEQTFKGNKTLTDALTIKNHSYSPNIGFYPSEASGILGKIYYATSTNDNGYLDNARFQFRQYSYKADSKEVSEFYERYVLPTVTPGLNSNSPVYEIFTSKDYTTLDDRYVNITGDTMTGDLKFTTHGLHFIPGNTDQYLWKVYGSTDGSHGFRLQYDGSKTGNDNSLSLYADNQQGTEIKAATMLQDGSITLAETLTISKTTNAAGTANNKPALIVGGTSTTAHLELDSHKIMAKSNGTTVAALYLNSDGGLVHIGSGGLQADASNIEALSSDGGYRSIKATNSNGSVGIHAASNRGLKDFTGDNWIIYRSADGTKTYVPQWGTKGSASSPIYFSGGEPIACNSTLDVSVTGNAATASGLAYPTQISTQSDFDAFKENKKFKVGYWNSFTPTGLFTNGIILSGGWTSDNFGFQIAIDDDPTWKIALRQKSTTWSDWKYIPMADGTNASGTWGIGITGNAATATAFSTNRTIALTGDVTGSASANGSSGWSISTTVADDSHNHVISNVDGLQTALNNKAGGDNCIDITVGGDANTYYPVVLANTATHYPMQFVNISRYYAETAPDTWNTATHRGGLTMTLFWNGSRFWDGNGAGTPCHCVYLYESYSTMVGGLGNSTSGIVVWLRGGTAAYHIHSLNGKAMTATVYTSTYTDSAGNTFAPTTTPVEVTVEWPGDISGTAASAGSAATATGALYLDYSKRHYVNSTYTAGRGNRFYIRQYRANSGSATNVSQNSAYEQYNLPNPTPSTSNTTYTILTSKTDVTVSQGGTGSSSAGAASGNALYNLGIRYQAEEPTEEERFEGMIWLKPI